jgi:hypothetical protein
MSKTDNDLHHDCVGRFISLANEMSNESIPKHVISAGLMTASGVYATYNVAGNSGTLNPSGIAKVADAYKQQLEDIQTARKAGNEKRADQQISDRIDKMVQFTDDQ